MFRLLLLSAYFMLGGASTTIISYIGDPSVSHNGTWFVANTCGNETSTIGASVTLTFNGTGADLVGPLQTAAGTISITLDGQHQVNVDNLANPDFLCNQVFYQTPVLQNGPHKLTATLIGAVSGSASTGFAIEYFSYTVPDEVVQPATSTGPTTSAGAVIGILIGGAAAGSITVAFFVCCIPIIRRSVATRGAVTGDVQTGLYKIVHDNYLNTASAANGDDASPIGGISYKRIAAHQWSIVRQANGRYQIQNHQHQIFAGWPDALPVVGSDIVNLNSDRANVVEWVIQESRAGSRKYRILATDTSGRELYWSLCDQVPNTPISLEKHNNPNCLWTLCLLEGDSSAI